MKKIIGLFPLVLSFVMLFSCLSVNYPGFPLITAAKNGKFAQVKKLVENGADINEVNLDGYTALERAASNNYIKIVEYLLSKNPEDTQTAFHRALYNCHTDVSKLFVDGGYVDVNIGARYFGSFFRNSKIPFEQQMRNVKYIAGDNLNSPYLLMFAESKNYQQMIDFFHINLEDRVDSLGNSILHIAAKNNNYDLVEYLLDNNFNVNLLDNNYHTALFYCITSYGPSINWNLPVIEDEKTAKINYISDMPFYTNSGKIRMTQARIGLLLLDRGININQQNNSGWTVLHFAYASYPKGPIETLIECGADINLKTNFGRIAKDI